LTFDQIIADVAEDVIIAFAAAIQNIIAGKAGNDIDGVAATKTSSPRVAPGPGVHIAFARALLNAVT
jgi:hypothetical protein